jgi:hypothetical protein
MRTTVTIDPDTEALLRKAMRERDASFKQVLNQSIREALGRGRAKNDKPFEQITFDMGKPLVDLTKALSLSGELEDTEVIAKSRRRRAAGNR